MIRYLGSNVAIKESHYMNINGVPITTCSDETLRAAFDAIGKAISTGPEAFAQYYAIERELERRAGASTPEQEIALLKAECDKWRMESNRQRQRNSELDDAHKCVKSELRKARSAISATSTLRAALEQINALPSELAGDAWAIARKALAASPSPPVTQKQKNAELLISDVLAEYADERTKEACDVCEDCGEVVMCRFHSVLSALDRGTWTNGAIERANLRREVANLKRQLAEQAAPLAPPETCAWRDEGWERVTGCGHRSSMLPSDPTRASIGWKGCPYCLRPLSLSSGGTPKGESK